MDTIAPAQGSADFDVWTTPLDRIDPSRADLFASGGHHEVFRRLRRDDPVHYCAESPFGPYWSITKFNDIMAVDSNHAVFSSNRDIVIGDQPDAFAPPMFIAMDPPRHDVQRKAATPGGGARAAGRPGGADPPARRRDPRRPAAQRDLQLGGPGLQGADHPDAGDPVRLPLGGSPPAALLVGCHHHRRDRGRRRRGHGGSASGS